ncbi:MAG TPA: transposase [Methylibium sp.]
MNDSDFSEERIAYALRLTEGGAPVVDVCWDIGISQATFNTWREKYGNRGASELQEKLRMLEDENARLRRRVADLTLAGCASAWYFMP